MDIIWDGPSGQEKYIAVGNHGTVLYSTNELDWNRVNPAPTNSHLHAVAWGNNTYVALGSSNTVLTSTDGVTWVDAGSISGQVYDLTWSGSQFVAVHGGGNVSTSSDGITWILRSTGINRTLSAVNWSGSRFTAVGDDGVIFSSQNGINWHPYYNSVPDKRIDFNDIACSDDDMPLYVVVGGRAALGMGGIIITSSDAINWTERSSGSDYVLNSVTRGGPGWPSSDDKFVAVGDGGTVLTSANGTTWTAQASGINEHLLDIAWGGHAGQEKFVAVGSEGATYTSPDGNPPWTKQTTNLTTPLNSITFGGTYPYDVYFVAVGGDASNIGPILTSSNGETWINSTITTNRLNGITYSYHGGFIAVGNYETILGPPSPLPAAPATPSLVSPTNGEVVSGNSVTFNWNHSNGAVWYRLLVFEKYNPSNEFYDGNVGNFTSKTVSGFPNDGTVYSWTVSANNASGSSGNSNQRDFINGVRTPTITSLTPNSGTQGQNLAVTIRGTNLFGATDVSFGSGITVDNYTVLNETEIAAFILIAADAATGARNVSVTTPVGTGTRTGGFTVEPAATGSIQVRIFPVGARNIGAKWRLTTGPDTRWKNHNATISGLAPGILICYYISNFCR